MWAVAAGLGLVFVSIVGYGKWVGLWQTAIADALYRDLILRTQEFGHPGLQPGG